MSAVAQPRSACRSAPGRRLDPGDRRLLPRRSRSGRSRSTSSTSRSSCCRSRGRSSASFWTQRSDALERGLADAEGGARRLRDRLRRSASSRPSCSARFRRLGDALMPIAIAANAIPIIAFAPIFNAWFDPLSLGAADGDRRRPLLLPGDGQHAARPDLGPAVADRADALLRGGRARDLPPRPRADRAAVRLRGIESRDRPRDDRRHRERLLRDIRLAGDHDQELRLAVRLRDGVGGDPHRQHPRRRSCTSPSRSSNASPSSGIQPVRKGALHEEEVTPRARARSSSPRPRSTAALGMSRAQAAPKLTKVTLQLKWVTQAQFAGYYAAVEKGYYKKAGLDVKLKVGGPDITPEQVVLVGPGAVRPRLAPEPASPRARRAARSSRSRRSSRARG